MKFKPLSENAVVIYFGENVDELMLLHISAFNKALYEKPFTGFLETVPAFISLTIYFDASVVIEENSLKGAQAYEKVIHYLKKIASTLVMNQTFEDQELIHIPVCYDEIYAPDLAYVAKYNQLTIDEVIHIHCSATYTVYMIGFMPGFPYLGGMSTKIAAPRKGVPRSHIPAGSVGIGGEQTGIYPLNSPGGWQLIGRTPVQLFNAKQTNPSLLKAGQSVRFYPIDKDNFATFSSS